MALETDKYTYRVTWSEEDDEFIGLCAEFPSLSWLADTNEKALDLWSKIVSKICPKMERKYLYHFLYHKKKFYLWYTDIFERYCAYNKSN